MISARVLQTFLKTEGNYTGAVDGIPGPMTYSAARAALKAANVAAGQWTNDRVWIGLEQLFLNRIMGAGLIVDGMAGEKTTDAIYFYTAQQLRVGAVPSWPLQRDVRAETSMFGKHGQGNLATVNCPFPMFVDYDRAKGHRITTFQAHKRVVASLERILQRTLDHYGPEQIRKLNLDINSGCYNNRETRGSSSRSLHAWGVAIDIDAAHNQMDDGGNAAAFSKPAYAPFIDFFEDEGAISLGRARNFDWMHFQFARL